MATYLTGRQQIVWLGTVGNNSKLNSPGFSQTRLLHVKQNPLISQKLSLYFHRNFAAMINHTEHLDRESPFLSSADHSVALQNQLTFG
jgi:hypothetical protein